MKTIRFKIIIPCVILIITFTMMLFNKLESSSEQINKLRIEKTKKQFNDLYKIAIEQEVKYIKGELYYLMQIKELKDIFLTQNKDKLFTAAKPIYSYLNSDNDITHFYFMDAKRKCFLRVHSEERFGDTINRITSKNAESTQKTSYGLELGPLGTFTLRVVQPWYVGNELIGYLELGKELTAILPHLESKLDAKFLVTINKSLIDKKTWILRNPQNDWEQFDEYIAIYGENNDDLKFSDYLEEKFHIHSNGKREQLYGINLLDAKGNKVGYIFQEYDLSKIAIEQLEFINHLYYTILFFATITIIFLWFYLGGIEKRIRFNQKRFEDIANCDNDLIWEINSKGEYIYSSENILELLGYSVEEVIGKTPFDFMSKEKAERIGKEFAEIAEKQIPFSLENEIIHKNGTPVLVLTTGVPIIENGKYCGYRGVDKDITQIKRAEKEKEELISSLEQYKWLFDMSPDYIFIEDKFGKFIFVNSSYKALFPEISDFKGLTPFDLFSKSEAECFRKCNDQVMENKKFVFMEDCIDIKGNKIEYLSKIIPLLDSKGELQGVGGIITNITHLKEIEKELITAKNEAEEAVKMKARFLSNMSHEIRTPLNGICGLSQILAGSNPNDNQKEHIKNLEISADRLLRLVNDILDFSKIEAGKVELYNENFDLKVLGENCINTLMNKAKEKGIDIKLVYKLDKSFYKGDSTRIQQILLNLISNAIKFTAIGGIDVIIENCKIETGKICFKVKDTGIGMTEDVQNKIFGDFMQADSSTTKKYGGTGLGLSISNKLAQLMGGKIVVESEVNIGSTFSFAINLKKGDTETVVLKRLEKDELKQFNKDLILLVDDDSINIAIGKELLRSFNLLVDSAENGKEAIDKIKVNDYAAVLMDIQMPVMDGFEATKVLRGIAEYAELPIIAVTANTSFEEQKKYKEAGFTGFLPKPYNKNDLKSELAIAIKSSANTKSIIDTKE